ncbi:MAG: glycosyltransferase family 2 protein [Planctomycetes bacterium]|nr:glycosyltransferase family 2 protein [Planctomycetota bacterium]
MSDASASSPAPLPAPPPPAVAPPVLPAALPASLSVVVPAYNERENLPLLLGELRAALTDLGRPYEIIVVDDGSADGTREALRVACASDPHVVGISFRRNFGQTAAMAAGFARARGEVILTLDGDLQNDPRDFRLLLDQLTPDVGVVSGWRHRREDAFLSRTLPSRIANGLISRITGVHLHDYGCSLKAYRRDAVSDLRLYGEMHRFLPAIASWSGTQVVEVKVNHRARVHGASKYGIFRTFKVILDLITVKFLLGFSTKPMYFFGFVGLLLISAGLLTGTWMVGQKIHDPEAWIHRNPLLHLSAFLAGLGVQFILIGLLAELCVRIYHEVGPRTSYAVRATWDAGAGPLPPAGAPGAPTAPAAAAAPATSPAPPLR